MNETSIPEAAPLIMSKGVEQQLLNLIPPDAAVVVEIGCTMCQLGACYKRRNPAGKYIGVEIGTDEIEGAAQIFDEVITTTSGAITAEDIGYKNADCLLIHGHILDNIIPEPHLQQLLEIVTDEGIVLVSFENKHHWSYIKELLQEDTPAQDLYSVLQKLDSLCTLNNVQDILEQAGLVLLDVIGVGGAGVGYQQFLQAAQGLLKSYGIGQAEFTQRFGYRYFVVRAVKKPPERSLLIQAKILSPIAAVNDKRINEPVSFLRTIPGVRAVSKENNIRIAKVTTDEPRIFLWQRPIMTRPDSLNRLRQLLRAGYLVIVEFDDDPRRWPDIVSNDYLTFCGVHGVQTSTDELARLLRQFNPNVAVFPNQMLELPDNKERLSQEDVVQIFFGALNRQQDWQPVMPALNRVLCEYGDALRMIVVHDRNFYDALETSNKSFQSTCNYAQYQRLLHRCDIGLLPLEPTEFNYYKSDLKFIEHAAHGVVALASPTVYADSILDGETGMLFNNEVEFEEKLRLLISNVDIRYGISTAARRWVADSRLLGQHYHQRYDWYQEMLDQLPKLNQELRQRVPELFP